MRTDKLAFSLFAVVVMLFLAGCGDATRTNQAGNTNSLATATPVASAPTATPDEFATARATYAQFCIRCHKPDGEGGIFELEDGAKLKVPSFHEGHALKHSDKEYVAQITNGGDGMPAFKGKLEPERIDALVRFIRHEFQVKTTGGGGNTSTTPAH